VTLLAEAEPGAVHIEDPRTWDTLVQQLGGALLQTWRWGELKRRHGWRPVRVAWFSPDGALWAAAQILFRQLGPLSVGYIPRGPLAASLEPPATISTAFRRAIDHLAARSRAFCLLAEPQDGAGQALLCAAGGWRPSPTVIQPRRTIRVTLDADDETLLARMKPKTRYNIRLAERRGVRVRTGTAGDLSTFYALLRETSHRDRFGIHRSEYFDDLLEVFADDAGLLLADKDDEPAAAVLVIRCGIEAVYLYGASAARHQRHMASYLVQFAAMRWARDRGCRVYDLWGIPPEDEPPREIPFDQLNARHGLWGVYRFKLGFGGEIHTYPATYERAYSSFLVWAWHRLRPMRG
jgi:lipid II:glycine glycyltransferase (peptidoglycan interpeptide bridge formation enzyme)